MITIKGWTNRRDMCIISKACENIAAETAVSLIEAAKTGPSDGRIRMPGGKMLKYNRYPNGRIILEQLA